MRLGADVFDVVEAYHGTTMDKVAGIQANGFVATTRSASWLGFGNYFFLEASGHCARWAQMTSTRPGRGAPVLIRAQVDLSDTVNLLDNDYWELVRAAYQGVPDDVTQVSPGFRYNPDLATGKIGWNYRDCRAINAFVERLIQEGVTVSSLIAAFAEGEPIDKDSWLFDEAHVCINVLDKSKINILEYLEIT